MLGMPILRIAVDGWVMGKAHEQHVNRGTLGIVK